MYSVWLQNVIFLQILQMAQNDSNYEENLHENAFLKQLLDSGLLEGEKLDDLCICVPQKSSLIGFLADFTATDFGCYVFRTTALTTLTGSLSVFLDKSARKLTVGQVQCRILFEETYYDDRLRKYHLICVDSPFLSGTQNLQNGRTKTQHPTEPISKLPSIEIIRQVEQSAVDFINIHLLRVPEPEKLELQLKKAFKVLISSLKVEKDIFKPIESYYLNYLYQYLFPWVVANSGDLDAHLNKRIWQIGDSQGELRSDLANLLPLARAEMAKITGAKTPATKLRCLSRSLSVLTSSSHQDDAVVTTDDLLQSVIAIISSTNLANWHAQFSFMRDNSLSQLTDHDQFHLATLEAALEYLRTCQLPPKSADWETPCAKLSNLLGHISADALAQAQALLTESPDEDKDSNMCHPLCDCLKCQNLAHDNVRGPDLLILPEHLHGRIALHYASYLGRPLFVDLFLNQESVLQLQIAYTDFEGKSALHLAALAGQQNALLLLLYKGIDANLQEKNGNTALHLTCMTGNENCAKALLYYAEHQGPSLKIDCQNNMGDSPIHLAAQYGHANIVKILAECGARTDQRNRRNLTPFHVTENAKIKKLLL